MGKLLLKEWKPKVGQIRIQNNNTNKIYVIYKQMEGVENLVRVLQLH